SNAWIGQVEADQLAAVSREPIQQREPRGRRLIRHMVSGRLPTGMLEGNERVGEGVASNDQPVATGEFERNVALCVARCVDDAQPGTISFPGLTMFTLR